MMIIAFAPKTSKILPKICCGKLKHVAPIAVTKNKLVMYQFIHMGKVEKIRLQMRDIKILSANGWQFVYLSGNINTKWQTHGAITCVQYTKHVIGIKKWYVQTPMQLYKMLK